MRVIGRILSVATLLVLVGLPAAVPCQTSKPAKPPITVSKETTWITEPLNPDPEPDVTIPDVEVDYDLLCRLTNERFAKVRAADALPSFEARTKAREALSTSTSPAVKEALDIYRNTFKMQASFAKLFERAGTRDPQRLTRLIYEFESSTSSVFGVGEIVETTRAWPLLAKLSAAPAHALGGPWLQGLPAPYYLFAASYSLLPTTYYLLPSLHGLLVGVCPAGR